VSAAATGGDGRTTFFGNATVRGDAEVWVWRMRLQLRAQQAISMAAMLVGVAAAATVVESGWAWVFVGAIAADIVVIEVLLRRLRPGNFAATAVAATAATWMLVLVLAALIPYALPILLLAALLPLLATVPLLEQHEIRGFIGIGVCVVAATTVIAVVVDSPITDQLPQWLRDVSLIAGVVGFTVPIAFLAWDSHVRHAVGIHRLVDVNDALRSSRSRLVAVADEERRQLERNLHDGAQQRLVSLAVRLRLLGISHPAVAPDVDGLLEELQSSIDELRDLAHGIYPPLLERGGLGDALRATARRSSVDVVIDAVGIDRYDERIETAVYFCCLEAIQNVAKHGGPEAKVVIALRATDHRLELSIADDGPGFDLHEVPPGRGLRNMIDRVAAIDGDLDVESQPGEGVRLEASIPLGEGRRDTLGQSQWPWLQRAAGDGANDGVDT